MAKRLNIFTHLQQAQGMDKLTRRCPQPGTAPWITVPRLQLQPVEEPKQTISIGAPEHGDQPHPVRIVLVTQTSPSPTPAVQAD